jgi:glycosyltransferase involved in cell wall biosynthesis
MRIAIDYTSAVRQRGGIGRYTRELVQALAALDHTNDYLLLVEERSVRPDRADAPKAANFRLRSTWISEPWLTRLWQRLRVPLPVETFTGPVDIFHAPDFVLPPTRRSTRTLLTIHDLSFIRDPDSATPALRAYLERVVPRSVARADHILADSAATREDLLTLYGTPPEKVSVLYSGVNEVFRPVRDAALLATVCERYGLRRPFILSVGTLQPRKNYLRLIRAFARARQAPALRDHRLVIAGGKGWLYDDIFTEVERLELGDRVVFPGFVADADLPALYSAAAVFVYPSLYEGFGLPVLEAMACGTPAIVSNASSLPEVAGNAALLVDPTDEAALARALQWVLTDNDLRIRLVARGLEQANRFTWAAAAAQLLKVYESIVSLAHRL